MPAPEELISSGLVQLAFRIDRIERLSYNLRLLGPHGAE